VHPAQQRGAALSQVAFPSYNHRQHKLYSWQNEKCTMHALIWLKAVLIDADSHFDYSRPARTLLEASARRMAQHARGDSGERDPADSAVQQTALIISFMAAYAAAAAAGTANWATFSDVKDMFAEDAVLVTQDRQVFKGKQQVLRRLDQGEHAGSTQILGLS